MKTRRVLVPCWLALCGASIAACGEGPVPGGNVDAATDGALCSSDNWCVENPLPNGHSITHGNDLTSGWGVTPTDVWAIGTAGTVMHWDGTEWSWRIPIGSRELRAIWGAGADDIWAVGSRGDIFHWIGTEWSSIPAPTTADLNAVWGVGPADVWAVGYETTIIHWDGNAWTSVSVVPPLETQIALNGIWGSGSTDFWAVGDIGTIIHWDGSTWSVKQQTVNLELNGVWGSGRNDVWAVGGRTGDFVPVFEHWDGSAWSATFSATNQVGLAIWGSAADNVYVVGYGVAGRGGDGTASSLIWHLDGRVIRQMTPPSGIDFLSGVWGIGSDAWAVGSTGILIHHR